jgi:hypothetical protein
MFSQIRLKLNNQLQYSILSIKKKLFQKTKLVYSKALLILGSLTGRKNFHLQKQNEHFCKIKNKKKSVQLMKSDKNQVAALILLTFNIIF